MPEKNNVTLVELVGEKGANDTMAKGTYKNDDFSLVVAGKYHEKPDWNTTINYSDIFGMEQVARFTFCRSISSPDCFRPGLLLMKNLLMK